uniref:Tyrosine-protein kinase ephrin type A/B receptor-like domain-containing protein n=1 Tax=Chromera velia CCMP2878 TaxID=1169474 RepID=A0A0G4HER0_9ALVE|eukprot:Cvel_6522.t1-p1 / transcript=Cvel_6522.t1 / gene=Cvel_6522 / organism=Chromera_velia_CCMP2878 / gene_product=hypothetical protein / transcript_product=hypothetical protein / location=Cvel_scaffold320:91448-96216(-) / protein_length=494 / sequence_SO=supercontig / SO=protein_coding / is_pseudo=false
MVLVQHSEEDAEREKDEEPIRELGELEDEDFEKMIDEIDAEGMRKEEEEKEGEEQKDSESVDGPTECVSGKDPSEEKWLDLLNEERPVVFKAWPETDEVLKKKEVSRILETEERQQKAKRRRRKLLIVTLILAFVLVVAVLGVILWLFVFHESEGGGSKKVEMKLQMATSGGGASGSSVSAAASDSLATAAGEGVKAFLEETGYSPEGVDVESSDGRRMLEAQGSSSTGNIEAAALRQLLSTVTLLVAIVVPSSEQGSVNSLLAQVGEEQQGGTGGALLSGFTAAIQTAASQRGLSLAYVGISEIGSSGAGGSFDLSAVVQDATERESAASSTETTEAVELANLCLANQRVFSNTCTACPAGTTNAAGDDASGSDTTCDATLCSANERVVSNACTACPAGTTNVAGDDASGSDTTCDATLCSADQRVVSNSCTACPAGTTNAAGDDASGSDTTCDATLCAANERVLSNACVACPSGQTNDAGDDASGWDTECDN